eukprot:1349955-Rhodomonas_salina.1
MIAVRTGQRIEKKGGVLPEAEVVSKGIASRAPDHEVCLISAHRTIISDSHKTTHVPGVRA